MAGKLADGSTVTKNEILALVKDYNANLTDEDEHLVLEFHPGNCRCGTCWYQLGGADRCRRLEAACKQGHHKWKQVGQCLNGPHAWKCLGCGNWTRSHQTPEVGCQFIDPDNGEGYR